MISYFICILIVRFVDIGGIIDHHCLNYLFIITITITLFLYLSLAEMVKMLLVHVNYLIMILYYEIKMKRFCFDSSILSIFKLSQRKLLLKNYSCICKYCIII